MKPTVHPDYHQAKVTCACGNTFTTGSTLEKIEVEVCNKCHPAYTGVMKFVDIKGKIDRFKEKQARSVGYLEKKAQKKSRKTSA